MKSYRTYAANFSKYKGLLLKLTIKDLKVKYKRSVLGLVWSLLNPLFTMIVLTVVFGNVFKFDIENFSAYLICGQVMFNFFNEATSLSLTSIFREGQLIKKVYIPKYIFPLSKVMYSLVNASISMIAVVIVCFLTNVEIGWSIIFAPLAVLYLALFSAGVGLLLASVGVFFRDLEHIYSVVLVAWMYLTPIFYPMNIIPKEYVSFVISNPLYHFIDYFRQTVLYGNIPSFYTNINCFSLAAVIFAIGLYVFYKVQDKFIVNI